MMALSEKAMMRVDRKAITFKFKHIYLPLIVLAARFLAVYSFLNWLLVVRSSLVPVADNVADFWLPLVVASILVLMFTHRNLGLLKSDARGKLQPLYHLAAVVFLTVPTIVAQGYLRAASGDITRVKDASEIATATPTKFYFTDDICVNFSNSLRDVAASTSRRSGQSTIKLYIAEPVCSRSVTTTSDERSVWIGLKARRSFENTFLDPTTGLRKSLDPASMESKFHAFIQEVNWEFQDEDPHSYRFLERVGRNADGEGFAAALRHGGASTSPSSATVLIPHKEAFEDRTGQRLPWVFGSYAIGATAWLGMVLFCPLDRARFRRWRKPKAAISPIKQWRLLIPRRDAYGLPILLELNVIVFVVMLLTSTGAASFDTSQLLAWGANYRPLLHGLGLIRLISSQFIHGNILHLFNNMYALIFAGIALAPIARKVGFIACYLLAGLGGSVASAVVHPATISVGASGSIFGLFGVLLTLLALRDERIAQMRSFILVNVSIFVGLNLLLGSISTGIDNAAHLGGLATGVVLGLVIFLKRPPKANRQKRARRTPMPPPESYTGGDAD
jgi:rhomboid protease GluP